MMKPVETIKSVAMLKGAAKELEASIHIYPNGSVEISALDEDFSLDDKSSEEVEKLFNSLKTLANWKKND